MKAKRWLVYGLALISTVALALALANIRLPFLDTPLNQDANARDVLTAWVCYAVVFRSIEKWAWVGIRRRC
jgi:hypothetical protein